MKGKSYSSGVLYIIEGCGMTEIRRTIPAAFFKQARDFARSSGTETAAPPD